jgi:DNA-binding transcriptional ArsR family regulator
VHAFDVLGDPVRRRILELLESTELSAGAITETIRRERGISQPAVSQQLRVLREHGFVVVRRDGARWLYSLRHDGLRDADEWLERFRRQWASPLDALATEVARGKRQRRSRS